MPTHTETLAPETLLANEQCLPLWRIPTSQGALPLTVYLVLAQECFLLFLILAPPPPNSAAPKVVWRCPGATAWPWWEARQKGLSAPLS